MTCNSQEDNTCVICYDNERSETFACGHMYCIACSDRIKREFGTCSFCNRVEDAEGVENRSRKQYEVNVLARLIFEEFPENLVNQMQIQNEAEEGICHICRDRQLERDLPCGHRLCGLCYNEIQEILPARCPYCIQPFETDIQEEDENVCTICYNNPRDQELTCGHLLCNECFLRLPDQTVCPFCRVAL